jgi:hypothetical protein
MRSDIEVNADPRKKRWTGRPRHSSSSRQHHLFRIHSCRRVGIGSFKLSPQKRLQVLAYTTFPIFSTHLRQNLESAENSACRSLMHSTPLLFGVDQGCRNLPALLDIGNTQREGGKVGYCRSARYGRPGRLSPVAGALPDRQGKL